MLTVQINEEEVKKIYQERLDALIRESEESRVFWDTQELRRQTCMSWNKILDTFFYDPKFPKRKIGGKWFFPARETRMFLERWISEKGEIS